MLSVSYTRAISQLNANATRLVALLQGRLVKLSQAIDWNAADERFGALYAAGVGRPPV